MKIKEIMKNDKGINIEMPKTYPASSIKLEVCSHPKWLTSIIFLHTTFPESWLLSNPKYDDPKLKKLGYCLTHYWILDRDIRKKISPRQFMRILGCSGTWESKIVCDDYSFLGKTLYPGICTISSLEGPDISWPTLREVLRMKEYMVHSTSVTSFSYSRAEIIMKYLEDYYDSLEEEKKRVLT